jgi:diguanylate cyclase (GGDEF)-like protein
VDRDRGRALLHRVLARFDPIIAMRVVLAGLTTPSAVLLLGVDGAYRPGRSGLVWLGVALLGVLIGHDVVVRRVTVLRLTWTSYLVQAAIMLFGIAADSLVVVVATLLVGVLTPVVIATVVGIGPLAVMCASVTLSCCVVILAQGDSLAVLALALPAVAALLASPALVVYLYRLNLERAVGTAHQLARVDALTGLLNRRGLTELVPGLLDRARQQRLVVGVLVADVDHFKRVNDVHGHVVGDEVLRLVADTVRRGVRPDDLVVRLGGEEIAVIAVTVPRSLTALAERLRLEVEEDAAAWGVTVSVGVAWREPADGDDVALVHGLLDRADELMYEAKRAGRNQVRLPV